MSLTTHPSTTDYFEESISQLDAPPAISSSSLAMPRSLILIAPISLLAINQQEIDRIRITHASDVHSHNRQGKAARAKEGIFSS
jgi:hypothetical protein